MLNLVSAAEILNLVCIIHAIEARPAEMAVRRITYVLNLVDTHPSQFRNHRTKFSTKFSAQVPKLVLHLALCGN